MNASRIKKKNKNTATIVESAEREIPPHGIQERPLSTSNYDINPVNDLFTKSDCYKNLKSTMGEGHKFEYLKKMAISRLEANLQKQFTIFLHAIESNKKIDAKNKTKPSDELSHNIFSWNWNDFLKRRSLNNFVWVDVLLRMDENQLHVYKFKKDFQVLRTFLDKIFDGLLSYASEEGDDLCQHIENQIENAKRVLRTGLHCIENELVINTTELKQLLYKEHFFINAKRLSEDRLLKAHLENRIWNSHIRDPIEVRYQSNWYQNIVKQNQYHMDKIITKYEDDINYYKQKLNTESFISDNCMDYNYSSIEIYKNRMETVQDKFDKEFDKIENKLTYIRQQINKLRQQRKCLSDEMDRFRQEEENMRLHIENEKHKEKLHTHTQHKSKTPNVKKVVRKQGKLASR